MQLGRLVERILAFRDNDNVSLRQAAILADRGGDRSRDFHELVDGHAAEHLDAEGLGRGLILCCDKRTPSLVDEQREERLLVAVGVCVRVGNALATVAVGRVVALVEDVPLEDGLMQHVHRRDQACTHVLCRSLQLDLLHRPPLCSQREQPATLSVAKILILGLCLERDPLVVGFIFLFGGRANHDLILDDRRMILAPNAGDAL